MSFENVNQWNQALQNADASSIAGWAWETFGQRLTLASSFGPEDVVLIDVFHQAEIPVDVFMLDTGRLHEETYELVERVRNRYRRPISVYFPASSDVEAYVGEHGVNGFYTSLEARRACCRVRKVEPLKRALAGRQAWVTGLRREQNVSRVRTEIIEYDVANAGVYKINPLAGWSRDEVWAYIRAHDVPHNALHERGFASIGCAPCTRAIEPHEDERAGRWWWENADARECGLHRGTK